MMFASVTTETHIKKMFPQTDITGISVIQRFTGKTNNPAPRIEMLPEM